MIDTSESIMYNNNARANDSDEGGGKPNVLIEHQSKFKSKKIGSIISMKALRNDLT